MLTNLSELVDPIVLERERARLLLDAADLRWAAGWLADNGWDPEDIMTILNGAEIAERRAAEIP